MYTATLIAMIAGVTHTRGVRRRTRWWNAIAGSGAAVASPVSDIERV
jgi:hypothetical protein